jgi:hypothetical protein
MIRQPLGPMKVVLANATPELRALDQQARSTRMGIWSGGGWRWLIELPAAGVWGEQVFIM